MRPLISTAVFCNDAWHPADVIRPGLQAAATGIATLQWLEEPTAWVGTPLAPFELIVLAKGNTTGPNDLGPWLTDTVERELVGRVEAGAGLLVLHAGTAGYRDHAGLRGLTGGFFREHPPPCAVTVAPVSPHPITADVPSFIANDEHYAMALDDPATVVLLESHSAHGTQPAGWVRTAGRGRVCVLTPGHTAEVWQHASFQRLLRQAMLWAGPR
ncbi:MAG TPA: ThuA domain-containing protein [Candidatus Synoicihabitans sp.]|nr:ThuA domain-containing protein [Candidatus Synoicihabitans sp.]